MKCVDKLGTARLYTFILFKAYQNSVSRICICSSCILQFIRNRHPMPFLVRHSREEFIICLLFFVSFSFQSKNPPTPRVGVRGVPHEQDARKSSFFGQVLRRRLLQMASLRPFISTPNVIYLPFESLFIIACRLLLFKQLTSNSDSLHYSIYQLIFQLFYQQINLILLQ